MRFIRDDIRVRDLDAQYKKVMRRHAMRAIPFTPTWNLAVKIPLYAWAALVEKVAIKGA